MTTICWKAYKSILTSQSYILRYILCMSNLFTIPSTVIYRYVGLNIITIHITKNNLNLTDFNFSFILSITNNPLIILLQIYNRFPIQC